MREELCEGYIKFRKFSKKKKKRLNNFPKVKN